MSASGQLRNLAFAGRQLEKLLEEHDPEGALSRLRDAGGPALAADVDRLRELFVGTERDTRGSEAGAYATLASLSPRDPQAAARFLPGFVEYVRQSAEVYSRWWGGLLGLIVYLTILCVLAAFISVFFAHFVLPRYEWLFVQMGGGLPSFTTTVFSLNIFGLPLFVLAAGAIVGLVAWFAIAFRKKVERVAPLPTWRALPMLARLARTYNYGLFLNFARLLIASGVPTERALEVAARHSGQPPELPLQGLLARDPAGVGDPLVRELAIAARLGNLASEIEAQCDDHWGRLAESLVQLRERLGLAVKLAVYALLAVLIVALYQPLFQLGNVV